MIAECQRPTKASLQVVFKPNDNKGILSEKLFQFPIRGGGGRGEDGVVIGQMKGNAEC